MASATPKLRLLRSRPLCIICARPAEADEISKALGIEKNRISGDEVQMVHDGHTFYYGSFALLSGEKLPYYVTSTLDQGIQSFTVHASVLFSILQPRFVIHAGVCAGYFDPTRKLNMNITDVVMGEAATNYEEGKMEYVKKQLFLRPHYNRVKCEAGDLQAFADAPSRPMYHYGEYISGSSVRTDANLIFEKMRKHLNRNIIALDMEASAFLQLCQHFGEKQAKSLGVIKGVSDFGDPKKGAVKGAYEHALRNTAKAIEDWVCHRIRRVTWTIDESNEPAANIVPGYYENFIRRVIDTYTQGFRVVNRDNPNVVIPTHEIKGLKTVLPKGNNPSFFQELDHIQEVVQRYQIGEVNLGGATAPRYLYYQNGYLIDWARTVNSLKSCEDGEYQVGVFGRLLSKCYYYVASDDKPARASVVSWDSLIAWLEGAEQVQAEETNLTEEAGQVNNTPQAHAEGILGDNTRPNQLNTTEADQSHDDREGRPLQVEDLQTTTLLGEERRESPARLEDVTESNCNSDPSHTSNNEANFESHTEHSRSRSSAARRFTSFSRRAMSREPAEEETGSTPSASVSPQPRNRTGSLSPRRSVSQFLQRFRNTSTAHEHEPLPATSATA